MTNKLEVAPRSKLTCKQAAEKVIYSMVRAGYTREAIVDTFNGLFYGEQWNAMELYEAVYDAFVKPAKAKA